MFASVRTVEPGALHDPLTIATECDEFASNPMRFPDSVEFTPEMFVMVTVPDGPNEPFAVTCTVWGTGVGAVASEQAAIAHTVNVLVMMPKRLMAGAPDGVYQSTFMWKAVCHDELSALCVPVGTAPITIAHARANGVPAKVVADHVDASRFAVICFG
jgi:hypothetical protein